MIQPNFNLKSLNTFGINTQATFYSAFTSSEEAFQALEKHRDVPHMILGGGSNVLFTQDFEGLILHNCILGKEVLEEDPSHVWVRYGAGEVWHEVVVHAIENGWGGIENLSLIPGRIGAAPMQNIGAYGVELKLVFESLEALNLSSGQIETFDLESCEFGYRESVFKRALKGQHAITHVTLRLNKEHKINTSYGAIEAELERLGIDNPGISQVSQAVINIRQSKLPDPAQIGNGGSFFKNPVVPKQLATELASQHPNMPKYPAGEGHCKLAAGWLIDQSGWKGYRQGDYGVHDRQALVLVNHGNATGKQIFDLSQTILDDVKARFGIELEREVNVI